ncbi:MAG: hypothetical protein HY456_02340 [Parcubacteria group bacterium]|nr:hypothetical protein [Parcubacteria group bacterium]
MILRNWTDVIVESLRGLWVQTLGFLPALIGAIVVFVIGLIIATGLGTLVERLLSAFKLDSLLRSLGIEPYLERAGIKLNSARFIGQLVFWFFTIAFLLAASDILGFQSLSNFLQDVLLYIPNIVIAALIMVVTFVAARFMRNLVRVSVLGARLHAANFLGALTWWAIVIFGFLTALSQLRIASEIVQTLVTGVIAMFALGGGIAFGLGGKDYAAHLLERFRRQTEG